MRYTLLAFPFLSLASCLFSACTSVVVQTPSVIVQPAPAQEPSRITEATSITSSSLSVADQTLLAGTTTEQQREIFRLGYLAYTQNKWNRARLFLKRALEDYPVLTDYSLYFLGMVNRKDGQLAEARVFFQRLLTEQADSVWSARTALELAKLSLAEQDWGEASRYAEQARSAHMTQAPVRQEAALVLAQAQESQGDIAAAFYLYQELRRITARSEVGKNAREHVDRLRKTHPTQFGMTTDNAYLEELRLLEKEGAEVEVDHLAQRFNEQFSASPLRSEVLVLLAGIYKRKGQVEAAMSAWKEVAERYRGSALAPLAMFDWATLLWNKDRDEEAQFVFEQLAQQYPRHEKAAEAWYAIGRIWQEKKEDSRAAAAYDRLASLFSGSQLAREGRWRQGWMAYRRRDFRQAEQIFTTLIKTSVDTPEGESALYWQARSQGQQSLSEKAEQGYRELLRRYPDGYYAQLAEKRLNIDPSPLKPGPERAGSPPSLSSRQEDHYRRSQALITSGFPALARRELDVVKDSVPRDTAGSLFLLAEYSRMDGYAAALRYAQELARTNGNGWMRYLYPQAYWSTITTHAQTKGLDPYLILALMRQESLFDPEAVSPARAYGLMQLLQKTAARITRTESVSLSALLDPDFNINAGTGYLRQLFEQFDGNQIMAVAAYNAGENAVEKWRTRYADLEPDEFVESISFRETRNYVKFVMRNYRTYRRLYGNGSTS